MHTPTLTPPSEPGALASYQTRCDLCGAVIASSLLVLAKQEAAAHMRWHAARNEWTNPVTGEELQISPAYEAEDAGVDDLCPVCGDTPEWCPAS